MLQVPIEILLLDNENSESVILATELLHKIQNTFKYSILDEIELHHKIHLENELDKVDVYDFSNKYKSQIRGYHPHLICVTDKYLIGKKYTNLFASLERKKGILTGNGIITSYEVQGIIKTIPLPVYFMFYLLINPLRFLLKEKIGHKEARICIYDTKVNKNDINKILKYGAFCLECNDIIRSVLSISEMKSVREVLGFISDVANSNNPELFFKEAIQDYKVSNKNIDKKILINDDFEEAIVLLTKSRIEEAFDKISLIIKRDYPDYYEQIIILFSRLNKLKLEKRMGVISHENELLESNKINSGLLEMITKIKNKN